ITTSGARMLALRSDWFTGVSAWSINSGSHDMPTAPPTYRPFAKTARIKEPRDSACKRGYGRKWREYAAAYLAANSRCAGVLIDGERIHAGRCDGQAECVDHIIAVSGADDPLFWDPRNHQPLSIACNSLKRQKVDHANASA